ncbi:cryptochrome/photolyase family protein [Denitrobaculum tricleocarpae]|uniref:Cryptochrome/photolyase family protein n=1 Tax=Denitrobaculum tricleocarpae TaxID=2591009 RepID=A0A545TFD6_9PROT|nr:cryptochrome/photolyase family protein [Denitrobaculum tricleocarpae]TQV75876.1 cryptochrome/photolyase family protein [Denitrobaculum tricleocarpae]
MSQRRLVLILGDQLTPALSSLQAADRQRDILVMAEVVEEATYVRHHKKKIAFLFSAMRHFAEHLRSDGWTVDYQTLDDPDNSGSLGGEIARAAKQHDAAAVTVTEPGEWRLRDAMEGWSDALGLPVEILPDTRFIASHDDFADWAEGRKQLRMEFFYREMRRKTGLLMEGDQPIGGKWNFDAENRKPAKSDLFMPQPAGFKPDKITKDVLKLVAERFGDHFGELGPFWFGVTAAQAEEALETFIEQALPKFGDFQDAMLTDQRFLYHSILSLYINAGLLDPLAVCRRVETEYHAGRAPLNAVEGFVRQIIGWREFVRGIYWLKMPDYAGENFFNAKRALPDFYWTAETDMACLRAAIMQTREEAYAHHIQRLMVTGNFAMLAGVDPKEVHEWYLMVYADAYEWVELPNTLGMSQFADGGLLGSKPYAASGNYINKMSDYCHSCRYKVQQKTGEEACPFNPLYWHFLERNGDKLRGNPRLGQVYRTWDRMSDEKRADYLDSADRFLEKLV